MKITLVQGLGLGGILLTGISGVIDTLGEDEVKNAVKGAFKSKPAPKKAQSPKVN